MRLRRSQYVFLLLLACCVQVGDDCAARQLQGDLFGSAAVAFISRESAQPASEQASRHNQSPAAVATLQLDSAAAASQSMVWQVRGPALDSAAVFSFTSFLRA